MNNAKEFLMLSLGLLAYVELVGDFISDAVSTRWRPRLTGHDALQTIVSFVAQGSLAKA